MPKRIYRVSILDGLTMAVRPFASSTSLDALLSVMDISEGVLGPTESFLVQLVTPTVHNSEAF